MANIGNSTIITVAIIILTVLTPHLTVVMAVAVVVYGSSVGVGSGGVWQWRY